MKLSLATLQMRFEDSQLSYFSFQKFSACKLQIFSKTAEKLINVGLSSRQVEWSRKFHQRARAVCESTESREKVAENWERQTFGKISFCHRIRARNPKIRLRSDSSLYLSLNHLKIYDEGQQHISEPHPYLFSSDIFAFWCDFYISNGITFLSLLLYLSLSLSLSLSSFTISSVSSDSTARLVRSPWKRGVSGTF